MADHERIRLVILGGAGVGKSAIIRRLLGQGFSERYRPTVEDLYTRECVLGTLTLKVDLLDTAGDLQFPAMRRLSIATAHAFLLVYATTSLPSFECIKRCFEEVREQRPDFQEVPIVVAGNKLDLATTRREVPIEDVSEWLYCELPKLRAKIMECSAKDDYNVKDIFRCFITLSKIVPKNHVGESDESGLRRRCSAYGSRRYNSFAFSVSFFSSLFFFLPLLLFSFFFSLYFSILASNISSIYRSIFDTHIVLEISFIFIVHCFISFNYK
uniref:GTP-binding protein Di-Ras2 n=1 Tax=Apis cerana TaxID=7461 RepID=V9IJA1_APICE